MLKVKRKAKIWQTDLPTKRKQKKKEKKKKSVMLETKATLKTMEKLFAKRIATFVCLLGSKPKFKFNFATKKKKKIQQPHYANPLFALIYFAN